MRIKRTQEERNADPPHRQRGVQGPGAHNFFKEAGAGEGNGDPGKRKEGGKGNRKKWAVDEGGKRERKGEKTEGDSRQGEIERVERKAGERGGKGERENRERGGGVT